jgi:hypothetical protein
MVGERAIQLRVVRPTFRALPFLAPVAGQATCGNPKSQIPSPKLSSACDGDCCAAVAAAASSL